MSRQSLTDGFWRLRTSALKHIHPTVPYFAGAEPSARHFIIHSTARRVVGAAGFFSDERLELKVKRGEMRE